MKQYLKNFYTEDELDALLYKYTLEDIYKYTQPETIEIKEIETLLNNNEEIFINSPDGYVPVKKFVDKGEWDEYLLKSELGEVRVNENHLFETRRGWVFAKDMLDDDMVLHNTGKYVNVSVAKTGKRIPIVDINVDHENHRYYANGFSSHNTGVGKSAQMCFLAGEWIKEGVDVLYITLELSEEQVQERIDANLLDMSTEDFKKENLDVNLYRKRAEELKKKKLGKLIVKEYPTSQAHVGHFRHLLNELKIKRGFTPKVIFVDYINICSSSRYKGGSGVNSYTIVKSIAEELRGLAVETDTAIITATQTTREGSTASSVDMTATSESFGLPHTLDLFIAITSPKELKERNRQLFILLKSRFGNTSDVRPQMVGVDWAKMRFYDVDDSDYETSQQVERVNESVSAYNKFNNVSEESVKSIVWD